MNLPVACFDSGLRQEKVNVAFLLVLFLTLEGAVLWGSVPQTLSKGIHSTLTIYYVAVLKCGLSIELFRIIYILFYACKKNSENKALGFSPLSKGSMGHKTI